MVEQMRPDSITQAPYALIMAGGSGTRFWPKSRLHLPKQLLALWDDKILLQHTLDRLQGVIPLEKRWIVTTQSLVAASKEKLFHAYKQLVFLGEPKAKNTASCILWGLFEIHQRDPDAVVVVLPADHYIKDEASFKDTLGFAIKKAADFPGILTLGVVPHAAATGFGYIQIENAGDLSRQVYPILKFVEKPKLELAQQYFESKKFLWNAGMFILRVSTGLHAYQKTMPTLYEKFEKAFQNGDSIESIYESIQPFETLSIDYGVMEPALTQRVPIGVIPLKCGWNDVGSFQALEEIGCAKKGQSLELEASGNITQTDLGLIALLGVNDLVVVREKEVVIVLPKNRSQDIRKLLEEVHQKHPEFI